MKMLFLAEDVSFAHVGRPSILAKWAKKFGVDVYFATGEAGKKQLQNSGWVDPIYNLNCISNNEFYKKVNEGKFFYTTEILESYIKNEVDLISKIKPDFVVSDFRLTANISCQIMGVKHISLTNAYWSPYFACPFPAPNNGIFKILPSKTTESLFRLIRPMIFKYFAKPIDSLRIKYGLAAHLDFRKTYTEGDYTLYFDLPQFVPLKNLPLHHKFIGPVNWSPNFVNDFNLPNKKLAYVTLGSTGNSKSLAMIIKTLVEKDFFVIASGINDVLSSELLKTLPLNKNQFLLKKMVNPEEFLSKCQITICHGGSGSIYQSLAQGCPVLSLPDNPDQGLASLALKNNRAGDFISQKNLTAATFEKKIDEITNNQIMKHKSNDFARQIQQFDAQHKWQNFLVDIAKQNVFQKITSQIRFISQKKSQYSDIAQDKRLAFSALEYQVRLLPDKCISN